MDQSEKTDRVWFSTSGILRRELPGKLGMTAAWRNSSSHCCLPVVRVPLGTELRDVIHLLLVIEADRSCMFFWQHWQSTWLFSTGIPGQLWKLVVHTPADSLDRACTTHRQEDYTHAYSSPLQMCISNHTNKVKINCLGFRAVLLCKCYKFTPQNYFL